MIEFEEIKKKAEYYTVGVEEPQKTCIEFGFTLGALWMQDESMNPPLPRAEGQKPLDGDISEWFNKQFDELK